jgi:hypothetical protein
MNGRNAQRAPDNDRNGEVTMTSLDVDISELRIKLFEARDQTVAMLEHRQESVLAASVRIATVGEFISTIPAGKETETCLVYFGALSEQERLPALFLEADWVRVTTVDTIAQVIYYWAHLQPIPAS